jgi:hypothetical protein
MKKWMPFLLILTVCSGIVVSVTYARETATQKYVFEGTTVWLTLTGTDAQKYSAQFVPQVHSADTVVLYTVPGQDTTFYQLFFQGEVALGGGAALRSFIKEMLDRLGIWYPGGKTHKV